MTGQNIKELPELISWSQTLPNTTLILQPLDENIESAEAHHAGNSSQSELWPTAGEVKTFYAWLKDHTASVKNHHAHLRAMERYFLRPASTLKNRCFVGQRNIVVYPNGQVSFCYKRSPIGTTATKSLTDVLQIQATRLERESITHCEKYCRVIGCNYSRGIKEYLQDKVASV